MRKDDFRSVGESERFAIRKRAVLLIESGKKKGEVAAIFGVRLNTITDWVKKHSASGSLGLKSKSKSKPSVKKLLTFQQERQIQRLIVDKMPDQYKLNFGLWTRKAVQELVERELGIVMAITTMGEYLRHWGFTPQKPTKRAYEQSSVKVQAWLNNDYPLIKQRAQRENAEIQWGDETGMTNSCNHGRSYAPKGQTPVKSSMAKRFRVNIISTVTNQGLVRFMVYLQTMNAARLIEFMQQLIKNSDKKIFLILDNLKVHHSKMVKEWLEDHVKDIEVFYLPSYSPEYNPDEYLNCDLKQGLSHKPSPKNQEKLQENIENHLQMLVKTPERVKKYFMAGNIKYAA